jgi:hypothetical protein
MTGFLPFRSLNSVMVVTLHVAVISYAVRSFLRPTSLAGSFAVWVPLTILAALFLSMPIVKAIAAAFHPEVGVFGRTCPRCMRGDLRPLLRAGSGLFTPVSGYRCAACRTTFRQVGETIIEEPALDKSSPVEPEGIQFQIGSWEVRADQTEIRFLDEPIDATPGVASPANIPARPVSEV